MLIQKFEGTMTSRERVDCVFAGGIPDRVPIDYSTNAAVHARLSQALGETDMEGVLRALGVDFRNAYLRYTGPQLFTAPPDRMVDPVYGHVMRWAANRDGGYWDFCDYPLQDAEPEQIDAFPVPSPDDFDYDAAIETMRAYAKQGYAVYAGNGGISDIINATGRVMGMEDTLVNLFSKDEATLRYIDRRCAMELGQIERVLDKAGEDISFVWIGEDLGTQIAPMISLELYRDIFRPIHQRFVDLATAYGKPVMVHTCGCSSWVYEDFIEMGVKAVDALQPEVVHMDPAYLKSHFGGRLCFHGSISTAGPLAYGTPEDVERVVRETLDIMMPGGGYMLAPTHAIQDNTPVENIIAMYNAAHRYGVYGRTV